MSKDTVSKLLASFFKEDKTRRKLTKHLAEKNVQPADSSSFPCVAVSGDAATLMAEMLRIFVRGEKHARLQLYRWRWQQDVSCLQKRPWGPRNKLKPRTATKSTSSTLKRSSLSWWVVTMETDAQIQWHVTLLKCFFSWRTVYTLEQEWKDAMCGLISQTQL